MLRIGKNRACRPAGLARDAVRMAYHLSDHAGGIAVRLRGRTREALFASAALAFTDCITPLTGVEPRRPEELALDAPELDLLLVDFLSELLYRFDTRAWLTCSADVGVRELDGGWTLEGTLSGEKLDVARHPIKRLITAVTYRGLQVIERDGEWHADVRFER